MVGGQVEVVVGLCGLRLRLLCGRAGGRAVGGGRFEGSWATWTGRNDEPSRGLATLSTIPSQPAGQRIVAEWMPRNKNLHWPPPKACMHASTSQPCRPAQSPPPIPPHRAPVASPAPRSAVQIRRRPRSVPMFASSRLSACRLPACLPPASHRHTSPRIQEHPRKSVGQICCCAIYDVCIDRRQCTPPI